MYQSLYFRDLKMAFNRYLDSISLYVTNKNIVVVFIYNLNQNIIMHLLKTVINTDVAVNVSGQRYSKSNMEANRILTTISYNQGKQECSGSSNYIEIGDRNLRLRNIRKHVPITTSAEKRIFNSISFRAFESNFTRFDVESGGMIMNVPNNPTAANTAFVTRNMNTRMSENVGLSVHTL